MPESPRYARIDDLEGRHPLLTPREHADYLAQLTELRRVRDHDLPVLLRDARDFVASDAVEEITQIHDDLALVDVRIAQLEALLRDARVLDDSEWDPLSVVPGRIVHVRYEGSGREVALVIASSPQGAARAVSPRSPVGQELLGRKVGDAVSVELPSGRTEQLTILTVEAVEADAAEWRRTA